MNKTILGRILTISCMALFFVGLAATVVSAQSQDEKLWKDFRWRNLGPGSFAGRVVDVEAVENDFRIVYCASASGGVWKSVNAGTTWEPIFDRYGSASIGDVAIFQKDPNIVWVGTGEANNRNSVAWGDGIYKSTDGGKTFENVGLKSTFQIARIVTHPTDPNTVYVAAIGNLWGYTGDRGLFKSTDVGKTWTKLTGGLPTDEKIGATDLVMDPLDANTLYVAFYERLRQPWRFDSGGPNGGIFKSTNAGKTWNKLTEGLPSGPTGRIGLAVYRKNPKIVMAIVEHSFQPREDEADYTDMKKLGSGIYRSEDGGKTWKFLNRFNHRPFYYSQIRINPLDDQRVYILTTQFRYSEDGGKTFRDAPPSFEGGLDFHAMWLDPTNKDRYYLGKDKGLTLTHDHGKSFILFDNMPIGQFYAIGVDMRDPYFIYGGTQDNGSWGGPTFSRDVRGIQNDSWVKMHWGDGMFAQADPSDWHNVYTEAENGSVRRFDAETHRITNLRPTPNNIVNYAEYAPKEAPSAAARTALPLQFRFNWRSPLVMSPHNSKTLYLGGNYLFKTIDGGLHWQIISPDLSSNDPKKTDPNSGGMTRDVSGAETHCTIVSISESPIAPGVVWVGTDDGLVHVTRNGGVSWTNVRGNFVGMPPEIWVSGVEASHFAEGTAYVTFDGHRSDRRDTWIFKTTDFGKTWTNLSDGLPKDQALYVVREDSKNRNLLFAGGEFAIFGSLDAGKTWMKLTNNFPTVATHDLAIHPRDGDLIAATHGRALWVMDDLSPLQQWTERVRDSAAFVFAPRPATIWEDTSRGGVRGHLYFSAENPPYILATRDLARGSLISAALLHYYLKEDVSTATIEISDLTGTKKRMLSVATSSGIHRLVWDLRFSPTDVQRQRFLTRIQQGLERISRLPGISPLQKNAAEQESKNLNAAKTADEINRIMERLADVFDEFEPANAIVQSRFLGDPAAPGEYLIRLTAGTASASGKIVVREDPLITKR